MSTWVCACICFSFVPEMIERMKVWYVIEFWHKCTEGLKNLIRISSIRNNKKYPTIKKIFEAGDFYAILSDIVEKIRKYQWRYSSSIPTRKTFFFTITYFCITITQFSVQTFTTTLEQLSPPFWWPVSNKNATTRPTVTDCFKYFDRLIVACNILSRTI